MTISFLPREHNMKAVNELKTYSEKLVSSIFRERAFKNISLLIEFWYRNRERGRRKWERYAANRVVVKWVEKWVRSKAVNYRTGGKWAIESLCLKPVTCLILKHIHTCSAHHIYICFQIKAASLCFHKDMAAVWMKIWLGREKLRKEHV